MVFKKHCRAKGASAGNFSRTAASSSPAFSTRIGGIIQQLLSAGMAPRGLRAIVAQLSAPDQGGRNVFTKKEGHFPGFLEDCTPAARLPGCFRSVFWQAVFPFLAPAALERQKKRAAVQRPVWF